MESKRFEVGEQFYWEDALWRIRDISPTGVIEIVNKAGEKKPVSWRELAEALFKGQIERVITGKHARPSKDGKLSTARKYPDYDEVPENLRKEAELRERYILPLVDLRSRERSDEYITEYIKKVKLDWSKDDVDILGDLSIRTTRRWMKDYEEGDRDRMALLPKTKMRGGLDQHKLDPQVEAVLEKIIDDKKGTVPPSTIDDVREAVAVKLAELNYQRPEVEHLRTPAKDTIIARVRERGLEMRFGLPSHKIKPTSRPHSGGNNNQAIIPGERMTMDSTDGDLIVVDQDFLPIGRNTIVLSADDATRYPFGRYLGKDKSYLGVAECVYHSILPKEPFTGESGQTYHWLACGIPREIVVDNGKIYISKAFKDACDSLNITLTYAPVRMPEFKAVVERQFRTLDTKIIHKLPGTTFSSIVQRGSYDSVRNACIMVNDFERILDTGIVGEFANSPHGGLDMDTPSQRWMEATSSGWLPRLPISAEDLVWTLGVVFIRYLFHYGFDIDHIRYNSGDLRPLKTPNNLGRPLKIKVNPGDISRAYVVGFADKAQPGDEELFIEGPIIVPARDDENYTQGLSMWKHLVIRRYVRQQQGKNKELTLVRLGQAKQDLQKIVADSMHAMSLSVRARAARFDETAPSLRSAEQHPVLPVPTPQPQSLLAVTPTSEDELPSFDGPPSDWYEQNVTHELDADDDSVI